MMHSDAIIGLISSHHYMPVVTDEAAQAAKHVSDPGNQHNNGPHQDQIFDNPLCTLRSTVCVCVCGGGAILSVLYLCFRVQLC